MLEWRAKMKILRCFPLIYPLWDSTMLQLTSKPHLALPLLHNGPQSSTICPLPSLLFVYNENQSLSQWWEIPPLLNDKLGHFRPQVFFNLKQGWADPCGHSCKMWVRASPEGSAGEAPTGERLHRPLTHCGGSRSGLRDLPAQQSQGLLTLTHGKKRGTVGRSGLVSFVKADFMYFTSIPVVILKTRSIVF